MVGVRLNKSAIELLLAAPFLTRDKARRWAKRHATFGRRWPQCELLVPSLHVVSLFARMVSPKSGPCGMHRHTPTGEAEKRCTDEPFRCFAGPALRRG